MGWLLIACISVGIVLLASVVGLVLVFISHVDSCEE